MYVLFYILGMKLHVTVGFHSIKYQYYGLQCCDGMYFTIWYLSMKCTLSQSRRLVMKCSYSKNIVIWC